MNVLLAHGYFLANDPNEQKIMKPYPPLGLLYISAALKRAGHQVTVFDATFQKPQNFREELSEVLPDALGLYANVITRDLPVTKRLMFGLKFVVAGAGTIGIGSVYGIIQKLRPARGESR